MKTGFICASGFNLVATATRDGKRLIAVVLGSPSPAVRAVKAAQLFERGFQVRPLSWLTPGLGPGRRAAAGQCRAAQSARGDVRQAPQAPAVGRGRERSARRMSRPTRPMRCSCRACAARPASTAPLLQDVRLGEPVRVFTGPPRRAESTGAGRGQGQGKGKTQDRQGQEVRRVEADRQHRMRRRQLDAGAHIRRDAGDDRRRARAEGQDEGGRRRPRRSDTSREGARRPRTEQAEGQGQDAGQEVRNAAKQ